MAMNAAGDANANESNDDFFVDLDGLQVIN